MGATLMSEVLDTKPGKARHRRRRTPGEWLASLDPLTTFLIGMAIATILVGAMVLLVGHGLS